MVYLSYLREAIPGVVYLSYLRVYKGGIYPGCTRVAYTRFIPQGVPCAACTAGCTRCGMYSRVYQGGYTRVV